MDLKHTKDTAAVTAIMQPAFSWSDEEIEAHVQSDRHVTLISDLGVIMFVALSDPAAYALVIAVKEDLRGQGHGEKLARAGIDWMFNNTGAEEIRAFVGKDAVPATKIAARFNDVVTVERRKGRLTKMTRNAWLARVI